MRQGWNKLGKFIAIEIGNKITKLVYGQDKKDSLAIKKYKIIENSEKIFNPEGDLNVNEIQPLLKQVLKEMKIGRTDCYLTVGGQSGIVRLREMPLVKLKDMAEIVRFEAEQFLPYNIEAFYIDYRVNQIKTQNESEADEETKTGNDNTDSNEAAKEGHVAEVMIVAAPKDSIDEQVALVDKLKLNIKRVDYYTDAVYCYFKKYVLDETKNSLVVDLGAEGMKLTMFNGKQYFANIFSELGVSDIIERYSEQNDLSIDETKKLLISNNFVRQDDAYEVNESLHSKLERLREVMQFRKHNDIKQNTVDFEIDPLLERVYEPLGYEVTKMMEFFKTRQFGMTVDELYLIGGGANMTQFDAFLKYYHNIDVRFVQNVHVDSNIEESDFHLLIPVIGGLLKGGN